MTERQEFTANTKLAAYEWAKGRCEGCDMPVTSKTARTPVYANERKR